MSNEPYNPKSIDAQIATIIANQNAAAEDRKRFFEVLERHDKKISNLEKWRAYVVGISASAVFLAQNFWDYMTGKHQ